MKRILLALTCSFLSTSSLAKLQTWSIDKAHSKVGFEITHLIISSVEGRFKDFSGTIKFDPKNPKAVKNFSVYANIAAASIDTDNEKRDEHLRSPDFFDSKKHKSLTFKSSKFTSKNGRDFKMIVTLTIAGVSKKMLVLT